MAITMKYDKTTALRIRDFLIKQGLTIEGVYGLMANIYCESGFRANNAQNSCMTRLGMTDETYTAKVDRGEYKDFVVDRVGYGICQWTSSGRKSGLLNYAKDHNKSIADETMQLNYLIKELKTSYKTVFNMLTTSHDISECAKYVMTKFERPANQSESNQNIRASYGLQLYEDLEGKDTKEEFGMTTMKSKTFVEKAIDIANNYKTLYVMGCFGAPLVGNNVNRYCNNHSYNKQSSRTKMIKNVADKTPPYYGFDCVCLIKGILWGWSGNALKTYGGATYCSNNVPDVSADGMIKKCYDVSTNFSNIVVGEVVWMSGHIGIYIGNGLAIESTPSWDNKVQITAVKNIGTKSGYNARQWTNHGKLPYIDYSDVPTISVPITPSTPTVSTTYTLEQFVKDVQKAIGVTVDGVVGTKTLSALPTVSKTKNSKHAVVKPLQKYLNALGFNCGTADGIAGAKFDAAVKAYQKANGCVVDGEITAKKTTWRKLLGM